MSSGFILKMKRSISKEISCCEILKWKITFLFIRISIFARFYSYFRWSNFNTFIQTIYFSRFRYLRTLFEFHKGVLQSSRIQWNFKYNVEWIRMNCLSCFHRIYTVILLCSMQMHVLLYLFASLGMFDCQYKFQKDQLLQQTSVWEKFSKRDCSWGVVQIVGIRMGVFALRELWEPTV